MTNYRIYIYLWALALPMILSAQSRKDSLTTKVVDVVKSYAPTIADAYKKRDEVKIKNDSITVKKKTIKYTFNSVPVASTFVPEKGKAAPIEKRTVREDYLNSYIGAGLGLLNTLMGEANITYDLNDNSKISLVADHLSSNGDVPDALPETNYANTKGTLGYNYQNEALIWGINGYLGRRMHNYYGIRPDVFSKTFLIDKISDMQQAYTNYGGNAYLQWANPYFKGFDFSVDALSDSFDSQEVNLKVKPSFEVPLIDGQQVQGKLLFDYYEGNFTRQDNFVNEIKNRWMLFGVQPAYHLKAGNLSAKLGVSMLYVDANQTDDDKFKAYPDVEASYALTPDAILHGGIKGTMQQNTLSKLSERNPYLAPMLELKPTNVQVDAFVGVNGKVATGLQYRVQGSYRLSKEKPLITTFTERPIDPNNPLPYQYYNAFGVVYDRVSEIEGKVAMEGNLKEFFFFTLEGKYNYYKADNQYEHIAWNLPQIQVSLYSDFKILPNLFAGIDIFYIGNRYDLDYLIGTIEPKKITLNGYIDVNLHADYTLNKHFQLFAKANNLSAKNHELWAYYHSQGLQIYGGLRFLFGLGKK